MANTANSGFPMRLSYSPDETAELLGLSRSTIYRMVENGTLPYKRIEGAGKRGQGRIVIPADALKKWLSQPDEPRNVAMRRKARDIAKAAVSKMPGSKAR